MRNGSTGSPRMPLRSLRAASRRSGWPWSSPCASPPASLRSRASRIWSSEASATPMPARCWTRSSRARWTSGSARGSLPRRDGNPLALVELPRGLTPAELAGGIGLPDAMPLRRPHRAGLPAPARTASAGDPATPADCRGRAGRRCDPAVARGPTAQASARTHPAPAEAAGLIEIGTRVRFRHPLVRSAACRAAGAGERRTVHRALAEATDPAGRSRSPGVASRPRGCRTRRGRSRPSWSAPPLGRRHRGGVAAAAAFLERATELTA